MAEGYSESDIDAQMEKEEASGGGGGGKVSALAYLQAKGARFEPPSTGRDAEYAKVQQRKRMQRTIDAFLFKDRGIEKYSGLDEVLHERNENESEGKGGSGAAKGSNGKGESGSAKENDGNAGSGGKGSGGSGNGALPERPQLRKRVLTKRDEAGMRLKSAHEVAQDTAKQHVGGSGLLRELANVGRAKDARERFKGWQRREGLYVLQRLQAASIVIDDIDNGGGEGDADGEGVEGAEGDEEFDSFSQSGSFTQDIRLPRSPEQAARDRAEEVALKRAARASAEYYAESTTDTKSHTMDLARDLATAGRSVSPRRKDVHVVMEDPMTC